MEQLRRFETLLAGFGDRLKHQESTNPGHVQLTILLNGFREARNRERKAEANVPPKLKKLLDGYLNSLGKWAEYQRALADDFNLFAVMDLEHDEATHSKILAWLLDRRIMHGTHAQGSLFFRLFLEELRTDLGIEPSQITHYAEQLYWVSPEVSGDKSRVDIEIAAYGQFVIHIENKIAAIEGPEQTKREWEDLETRRRQLAHSNIRCAWRLSDA